MIRVRRHFSKSFDRHKSKLIGLYEEVSVWSFPGLIDFFHLFGKQPSLVIALNSWHMVPTAHSGSSISIFGVIRSQPGYFFGCSCSFRRKDSRLQFAIIYYARLLLDLAETHFLGGQRMCRLCFCRFGPSSLQGSLLA